MNIGILSVHVCLDKRLFLTTVFVLFALSFASGSAQGATLTVTKTVDTNDGVCDADCSLREAVHAANVATTDDSIEFSPSAFGAFTTITLSLGEIPVESRGHLVINGTGASHLTITSNLTSRIFNLFRAQNFFSSTVTINNMTIAAGHSGPNATGGCIENDEVALTINNSIVRDCTATAGGGGIYSEFGPLVINNSAFTGNSSAGGGAIKGGAASSEDTGIVINNSTFAGNFVINNGDGGAIATQAGFTRLTNVTIASNIAQGAGGGIISGLNGSYIVLKNCIVAQNTSVQLGRDVRGEIVSEGYNLIQITTGANITGDLTGNITGQDPLLGPVQVNGGQMPTMALNTGSPAIDTGNPSFILPIDARGVPRPLDGDSNGTARGDIGSFEAGAKIVTKTADTSDGVCDSDCSLREAITSSNADPKDDVVLFSSLFNFPQTITAGIQFPVVGAGKLSVNGPGADLLTLAAVNTERLFYVGAGNTVVLAGMTLTNGRAFGGQGGGAIYSEGNLTVNGLEIRNNTSTFDAGAGIASQVGTLTILNSTIRNNTGIGVSNRQGALNINNSVISNNTGNGVANSFAAANISGSVISGNTVNQPGGGIANAGDMTIDNSVISGNSATNGGGIAHDSGVLTLINSQITGNSLSNSGSFIGGGLLLQSSATLTNVLVSGNTAACSGCVAGGIGVSRGTFTMNSSTVSNNSAVSSGGIWIMNAATGDVNNSTISGNFLTGSGGGGAGMNIGGNTNLTNVTITGNGLGQSALGDGGGIILGSANLTITSSTIAGNFASQGGGIKHGDGTATGTLRLKGSIIADNFASGPNPAHDILGNAISDGYNLIENTSGATITGITTGNIIGLDPHLLPLRNNGGPTATIALRPTSPAIDTGDPAGYPAMDQKGVLRPQDGDLNGSVLPDIGSYERQVNIFTVSKSADTDDGVCNADCSLREAIAATNASLLPDHFISFSTSFFSIPRTITLATARGELRVSKTGTLIVGGTGSGLLTINGNNQNRVLLIQNGAYAMIGGMTVTGGNGVGLDAGSGGAIRNSNGWLVVNDSIVRNSSAQTGGGISSSNGNFSLNRSTVRNNNVGSDGGALHLSSGSTGAASISNSVIVTNNATANGGAVHSQGRLDIENSYLAGNIAGQNGGGVYNFSGTAVIVRSAIESNTSSGAGGGLVNLGNLQLSRSSLNGNSAVSNGGAAFNQGTITIDNTTVAENVGQDGGGIYSSQGTTVLNSSTVAGNLANSTGGGLFNSPGATVSARNTIFGDNSATGQSPDFSGVLNSLGYNLIENSSGANITGTITGNIIGNDPKLGRLAPNGGPTLTKMILPGSPAIDFGDPSGVISPDQRGTTRPRDGDRNGSTIQDIGAVERDPRIDGTRYDFDGDGIADVSVFRPSEGNWYVQNSANMSVSSSHFGQNNDITAPGDFDGDGKADISVFRPSEGNWYRLNSSDGSFTGLHFGVSEDLPAVGDFDGDGKDDISVFRPSEGNWYRLNSSDGSFFGMHFGISEDKPAVGDFDGDGRSDISVFRPSEGNWYRMNSSDSQVVSLHFGITVDKPTPADFDGDGKTDVAVFRPTTGEWFRLNSSNGSFFGMHFGTAGDKPVAADYDGDGKADIAVFRPSEGNWYFFNSTSGFSAQHFGVSEDNPAPNSFVY